MKEIKYDQLDLSAVLQAQEILRTSPVDPLHDYSHALRTYENANLIIPQEGLCAGLDGGILKVSIWWHDIDRGREDKDDTFSFRKYCQEENLSLIYENKVVKVINEHSFGKVQTTLESKILYDADKLEYVSIPRIENLLKAKNLGLIDEKGIKEFGIVWRQVIDKVEPTLNFRSSKVLFRKRLNDFLDWGRKTSDFAHLANSVV